ncbi:hypothetical protein, partial [Dickeya undicola]|uniref:hypothetical protein n=1 Tax=Dickeya undicola TaxID=1577887 RepID=UPI0039BEB098
RMKKFFSAKALFFIFIISQNVYAEKETATDNVHALATPTPENASKKYSASFREVEIKEFVATAAQILK